MSTLKTHNLQSPDAGSVNIALAPNAGMVVAGLSTYSNQINVGSNIKLGTAGVVTATSFVGSGANLTGIDADKIQEGNSFAEILDTGSNGIFRFLPENSEVFRIATNGHVGINTNNPVQELTIFGDSPNFRLTHTGNTNQKNSAYISLDSTGMTLNSYQEVTATRRPIIFKQYTDERLRIDANGRFLIGTTSSRSVGDCTAISQIEGTSFANSSLSLMANAGASAGNQVHITLGKSRGSSVGSNTVVADGDGLGLIQWAGADGTDANSVACKIHGFVDGTPGSNDMPGRLVFATTADGASTPTERMRIDSAGQVGINDTSPDAELSVAAVTGNAPHIDIGSAGGERFKVGYEGNNCFFGASASSGMFIFKNNVTAAGHPQADGTERMRIDGSGRLMLGTTTATSNQSGGLNVFGTSGDSAFVSIRRGSDNASGPRLAMCKSRNTTDGDYSSGTLQDGDILGTLHFYGHDSQGFEEGASIQAVIDDTPGSNDMPTSIKFQVTPNGSDTKVDRMIIDSTGRVRIQPSSSILPGNDPSGGGAANTNGFLNLRADNGENALGLLNSNTIANNSVRGTVLTGINFINRNYYTSSGKAGTGYVIRNEKGHASYMDRCDLRFIPGYDGNTLYSNRSVVFEFDGAVRPGSDDYASLGTSSAKWTAVYATNGSIQTSDENLKQNIQSLSTAEMKAAASISKLFITYKWKSKVAKESAGGDTARIHTGVIAQQIKAALEAEGLTAANYSFWCENITWRDSEGGIAGDGRKYGPGVYDEPTGTTPSTDGFTKTVEYAVRYDELLSFVAAYNEQRFTSIESRLTALEGS